MTVAKGIGGGFPLGACLATEAAADGMTTGTHGTTYGGNPLACAVGCAVMDIVTAPGFLDQVSRVAGRFRQGLEGLVAAHPAVFEAVRGEGLMLGLKCRAPNAEVVRAGYDARVLVVAAADNVVRLLPPLNLTEAEADEGLRAARGGGRGGRGGGGVRHFLDLHTTPAGDLRAILAAGGRDEGAPAATRRGACPTPSSRWPGGWWRWSSRSPRPGRGSASTSACGRWAARRWCSRAARCSSATARPSPTPRACCRAIVDLIMIRTFEEATLQRARRASPPCR